MEVVDNLFIVVFVRYSLVGCGYRGGILQYVGHLPSLRSA